MGYNPRSLIEAVVTILQGQPKTIKPAFSPPGQGGPAVVGHGPFKCDHCGRYGQPGACEGCGAPNRPAPVALPTFPENRVVKCFVTVNEQRAMMGLNPIPAFDAVKR